MVFWWRLGGVVGNDDGDEDGGDDGDDEDGLTWSDISGLAMKSIMCRVISISPCWPLQRMRSDVPRDLSSPPSHIHPCQPHTPSTRPTASLASAT